MGCILILLLIKPVPMTVVPHKKRDNVSRRRGQLSVVDARTARAKRATRVVLRRVTISYRLASRCSVSHGSLVNTFCFVPCERHGLAPSRHSELEFEAVVACNVFSCKKYL